MDGATLACLYLYGAVLAYIKAVAVIFSGTDRAMSSVTNGKSNEQW